MFIKRFYLIVNILALFILGCSTENQDKPDIIVDIKVSKNGYQPSNITLPYGKVVLFRITAIDEGIGEDYTAQYYGHCFYILPPYDVGVYNIKKNETKGLKVKLIYLGNHIFTCPYCSGIFPTKGDLYIK